MKVCEMCGAQNDDVFTKCSVCGADLPSMNSQDGDDEKTVLIDPDQAPAQPSGLSLKTDTSTYGQADAGQTNPKPPPAPQVFPAPPPAPTTAGWKEWRWLPLAAGNTA